MNTSMNTLVVKPYT